MLPEITTISAMLFNLQSIGLMTTAADGREPTTGAYVVFKPMGQSIAFGTLRKNNVWFGWRGETPSVSIFGVPVHAAVTAGASIDREPVYAIVERDWRKTMLSADPLTSKPQWRSQLATKVGHKTVVEPLMMLSFGAEVGLGTVVRLSKSDAWHLSLEKRL